MKFPLTTVQHITQYNREEFKIMMKPRIHRLIIQNVHDIFS